jgi:flagellin-like protein
MPALRFRKNTKRAVSPIIATILLVAITVVLAAVLYVLISGLIHGPGNTPIASALGTGGAVLYTGTAQTGCAGATDFCYKVVLASVSSGVTLGSINLQVKTATGTIEAINAAGTTGLVSLLSIAGTSIGASPVIALGGAVSVASWASGSATTLVTSDTLWIDLGQLGGTSPSGTGLTLVIFGVGSYSGSESVGLP